MFVSRIRPWRYSEVARGLLTLSASNMPRRQAPIAATLHRTPRRTDAPAVLVADGETYVIAERRAERSATGIEPELTRPSRYPPAGITMPAR